MIRRRGFPAMGTDVELFIESDSDEESGKALRFAELEIRRLEGVLSRFRAESQLSRLNREKWIVASPDLIDVVELALLGRETTGGRFEPTVHDAMVAAGCDRPPEAIDRGSPWEPELSSPRPLCGVHVDRDRGTIHLDPLIRLDLRGIVRGYTADRVCAVLSVLGPCLVDVGGDIAVRGVPPAGAWDVGVEVDEGTLSLSLERGAMATCHRDRRNLRRSGVAAHQIDPATGLPVASDLLRATAVAHSAAWAEVLAAAFLVAGAEAAAREADALRVPCLLVTETGSTVRAGGLTGPMTPFFD